MSITPRTKTTVRTLGVVTAAAALALGVADTALACNIRDFSAVAACGDNGQGVIRVTDKDASGTPATITVYQGEKVVGTKNIDHATREGVMVEFTEAWAPKTQYRVHVKAGNAVDQDIQPLLTTPDAACKTETATPKPPASTTPKPSPSVSESSSAPAATPSSAASPAGGGDDLAETGGGSNTGLIAGLAGGLVAVGGALAFGVRRKFGNRA